MKHFFLLGSVAWGQMVCGNESFYRAYTSTDGLIPVDPCGLGVRRFSRDATGSILPHHRGTGICDAPAKQADGLLQSRTRVGLTHTANDEMEDVHLPKLPRNPRLGQVTGISFFQPPWAPVQSQNTSLCGKDVFALRDYCPAQCPFAAEMTNKFCHFRCVKKKECGLLGTNPDAIIPDEQLHACRPCNIEACKTCAVGKLGQKDKELERCVTCMPGYEFTEEGKCRMKHAWVFTAIAVVAAVAVVFVIAWYLRTCVRPRTNQEGVDTGLASQRRAMMLQTANGPKNTPYPISTNLLSVNVAGAGTICFFRFQFAVLVWATMLLAAWLGLAFFVSVDLLTLGVQDAKSPQLLCAVTRWGATRQRQLLWTKVTWLAFAYLFSFGCFVIYAIQQTKLATQLDAENKTMSDFAAVLEGLPRMKGTENVETSIKEAVERATGEEVVGVSAGWDYSSCTDAVMEAVEDEPSPDQGHMRQHTPRVGFDTPITNKILEKAFQIKLDGHQLTDAEMKKLVEGIECEHAAFVVFDTEKGRDEAVKAVERTGIQINGVSCTVETCSQEPNEVIWANMCVTDDVRNPLLIKGTMVVVAACLAWTLVLYLPYAHYMASFTYEHGDEPGKFSEGLFIGLVVGSQFLIFIVCTWAAKSDRFKYTSQVQMRYTKYYTAALILNLVLDITLQGYLSYLYMVAADARTASGTLLVDLTTVEAVFESYPMQKSVGKLLFSYCWPCTFLVPFLAEPICGQWVPQHMAKLLIGADQRIQGVHAMKAFELSEMEQRRYADLLFNIILVVCIPFISPAYLSLTLGALILSHLFIYCYDHVKVLRYVAKFDFSSLQVHHLAMQLFSIPIGILAGAFVLKANQLTGSDLQSCILQGYRLAGAITAAMVGHIVLHLLTLTAIQETCKTSVDRSESKARYVDVAEKLMASYFSCSPVHCLRSRYGLNQGIVHEFYSPFKADRARSPRSQ